MLWDYIEVNIGSNPLKLDYTWQVLRSTVTMATALIGAVHGSFLWKRGEGFEQSSREASGASVTPLLE
jgi:hypothetical protein